MYTYVGIVMILGYILRVTVRERLWAVAPPPFPMSEYREVIVLQVNHILTIKLYSRTIMASGTYEPDLYFKQLLILF